MRTRIRETRSTTTNGTIVVKRSLVAANELEWRLQAAAVRRVRSMPGYGVEWATDERGSWPEFTIAGDFNAARRSPQEAVKAKATGLTPGETDLRVYLHGARLKMIEYKGADGKLSADQKTRHLLLRGLGFDIVVVKAKTEDEAADATEALVRAWLGRPANDNRRAA